MRIYLIYLAISPDLLKDLSRRHMEALATLLLMMFKFARPPGPDEGWRGAHLLIVGCWIVSSVDCVRDRDGMSRVPFGPVGVFALAQYELDCVGIGA